MKTKFYFLAIAFLTANLAAAQVLYSEDFDNLAVGNVGTDITGQTPGQNGWYTSSSNPHTSNIDYQIAAESGRGNILAIFPPLPVNGMLSVVFREDLKNYWQRRAAGNDILKFSIDMYTTGVQPPAVM